MIEVPSTVEQIYGMIANRVQENIHLDYKDSRALDAVDDRKKREISKDASSFANSDGGIIIYGVQEHDHLPTAIDSGVDHSAFTKERLEQIIHSNVAPRIDDLRIYPIPLSADRSIFVVHAPESYRGPHQAGDKKYYKRFNFLATAMEDYEINDIRNRRAILLPLVSVGVQAQGKVLVYVVVSGIGNVPAQDVTFSFSEELRWLGLQESPHLFRNGIKYLAPGKSFYFVYNTFGAAFSEGTGVAPAFDIGVSYFHPTIGQRINDTFHIDLLDYRDSTLIETSESEIGRGVVQAIKDLKDGIGKLNDRLDYLSSIAGASGLNVSIPTLRNIRHIVENDGQTEKVDPADVRAGAFKELLGIGDELAYRLQLHFRHSSGKEGLGDLNGMTDEIMRKLEEYFILSNRE